MIDIKQEIQILLLKNCLSMRKIAEILRQKGLDIFVSLPGFSAAMHVFQSCSSGILAYSHARGAHYAMFDKVNETDAHFYNAVYRRRNHQENFVNFLHTYTILHGCIVIGVRKKETHD